MQKLNYSSMVLTLLLSAAGAQAQVGVLRGTVTGVKAGVVLSVFKGQDKVADFKVAEGGKFSVALATGVYAVHCPNGCATRQVDQPPERVLPCVSQSRDDVLVLRRPRPCHSETIARWM